MLPVSQLWGGKRREEDGKRERKREGGKEGEGKDKYVNVKERKTEVEREKDNLLCCCVQCYKIHCSIVVLYTNARPST